MYNDETKNQTTNWKPSTTKSMSSRTVKPNETQVLLIHNETQAIPEHNLTKHRRCICKRFLHRSIRKLRKRP